MGSMTERALLAIEHGFLRLLVDIEIWPKEPSTGYPGDWEIRHVRTLDGYDLWADKSAAWGADDGLVDAITNEMERIGI